MKILVIEPEKAPYEKEIGDDIHDMQAIVGGCIEPIYLSRKKLRLLGATMNSCLMVHSLIVLWEMFLYMELSLFQEII